MKNIITFGTDNGSVYLAEIIFQNKHSLFVEVLTIRENKIFGYSYPADTGRTIKIKRKRVLRYWPENTFTSQGLTV